MSRRLQWGLPETPRSKHPYRDTLIVYGALALLIVLLAATQAVEFLAPLEPGRGGHATHAFVRSLSPRLRDDRSLSSDIEAVAATIRDGSLIAAVESEVGELE